MLARGEGVLTHRTRSMQEFGLANSESAEWLRSAGVAEQRSDPYIIVGGKRYF